MARTLDNFLGSTLLILGAAAPLAACDAPEGIDEEALALMDADEVEEALADADADAAEVPTHAAGVLASAASDPAARICFFSPSREYTGLLPGEVLDEVADGVVLIYDAGSNSHYDYAMQYDYATSRVVNVVHFATADRDEMYAIFEDAEFLTRPVVDVSEYGSQFPIKTPAPPPPPNGCPWLDFVSTVRDHAMYHE
jgi:hypothetical protein